MPTKRGYLRLNTIRLLLSGNPRVSVCQIFSDTDRAVHLWIELYNRSGRARKVKLKYVRDLLARAG